MTTRAPSATKWRACDLPMPRAPPVINAIFPSSRPLQLLLGRARAEQVSVTNVACSEASRSPRVEQVSIPGGGVMRAAVLHAIGDEKIEIRDDVTVIGPAPGEVRIRVRAAGVCHSDLSARN